MSQRHSAEEEIDGHKFQVFMLPPRESLDVLSELGKLLGPSIGVAVDAADSGESEGATKAMQLFFQSYNSSKGQEIISKMASKSLVDGISLGKKENFDTFFTGQIGLLFKWLMFALKTQYSDFLESMGVVLGSQDLGQVSQIQQVFQSQNT